MNLNIFSDLRKPGLVPGESLSLSTKFDSVLEKNQTYIMSNRMRSLHMHFAPGPPSQSWIRYCFHNDVVCNTVVDKMSSEMAKDKAARLLRKRTSVSSAASSEMQGRQHRKQGYRQSNQSS